MAESTEGRRLVSIVYPVLNELPNVDRLLERMSQVVEKHPTYEFEFVVVDDGSTDGTTDALRSRLPENVTLRIITFSRNFGSHSAITAGIHAAGGESVILMGADIQEPLSTITAFLEAWSDGNEVVWGVRSSRAAGGFTGTLASKAFSMLFHRYTDLPNYPAEGPSCVLCDRRVLNTLRPMDERHRNLYGLIAWVGYRQTTVEFEQQPRRGGKSKWTTRKLVKLAFDSLVQFSHAPIRASSYLGVVMATSGFIYALFLVIRAFFDRRGPEGFTTLLVAILLIGGVQLVMLGTLGEYVWRGVDETRRRPLYVIDRERSDEALVSRIEQSRSTDSARLGR